MDSKDSYITKFLISKPSTMEKLAFRIHERLKTRMGIQGEEKDLEKGSTRAPNMFLI